MDTVTIELTREEARLIASLLPKVPVSGTIETAKQMITLANKIQGILEKIGTAMKAE